MSLPKLSLLRQIVDLLTVRLRACYEITTYIRYRIKLICVYEADQDFSFNRRWHHGTSLQIQGFTNFHVSPGLFT